jgi:hypothetical protein
MKRLGLFLACTAVALALAPAVAQAVPNYWQVKESSGGWKKLALGTPETLETKAGFNFGGHRKSGAIKGTCTSLTDKEVIENEPISEEGIDTMTAFEANCGPTGVEPCATGERFFVRGGASLPWPSEIVFPGYDAFENVEVEVECEISTATAKYHPPGHLWEPKIVINGLKSTSTSGVFKDGPAKYFYFLGTDTLTPTNTSYIEVR